MADEPIKPQEQQPAAPESQNQPAPSGRPQQPAEKKSTSGLAVAGLVLGLIALLSCWIPFFNVATTPLAILGLVFAIIGIVATAPSKPKGGRGIAIAGTVLCAISLVVFLAMYGGAAASVSGSDDSGSSSTETSATQDDDSSSDQSAADEEEDAAADSGIVIKSCKASKDYAGDKTFVITLDWTNNTDESSMFMTEFTDTAYVDGEEVDRTFGDGDGWYEDQKKVKPGKTKTIKFMYDWDGKSDVEFEVNEWFGSEPVLSQTLKVK